MQKQNSVKIFKQFCVYNKQCEYACLTASVVVIQQCGITCQFSIDKMIGVQFYS